MLRINKAFLRVYSFALLFPFILGHSYAQQTKQQVEPVIPDELIRLLGTHEYIALNYSGGWKGDLEPCKCTSPALGGVSRRLTALSLAKERARQATLVLDFEAGDSFIEASSQFLGSHPDLVLEKAKILKRYCEISGLKYLSLADDDLILGPEVLKQVVPSGAHLISTNVTFEGVQSERFAVEKCGDKSVAILSVIAQDLFESRGLESLGGRFQKPDKTVSDSLRGIPDVAIAMVAVHTRSDAPYKFAGVEELKFPLLAVEPPHVGRQANGFCISGDTLVLSPPVYGTHVTMAHLLVRRQQTRKWRNLSELMSWNAIVDRYKRKIGETSSPVQKETLAKLLREYESQRDKELLLVEQCNVFLLTSVPISEVLKPDPELSGLVEAYGKHSSDLGGGGVDGSKFQPAETCAKCHSTQFDNWKTTLHSRAFDDLVLKKSDRDPQCIRCHVTGYGYPGGPNTLETMKPFVGVQCQSCHVSNGKEHPKEKGSYVSVTVSQCMVCHTPRQDPRFDLNSYLKVGTCRKKNSPGEERVHPPAGER